MSSASAAAGPASAPPAAAVALLWDLDNVSVPGDDLPDLASALAALVPPQAPRIVAAHWRAYRTHRDMLAEQTFRVLCGGNHPDGTDGVLIRQARRLRRKRGIGQFVLASNDRDFARIAAFGSLHVVTLDPTRLSGRLRTRADAVTVLVRAPAGWRATTEAPS